MRCITLTQPWATLVAIGAKRVETRSWKTSYRGPLAIHAAKGFPKQAREFSVDPLVTEAFHVGGVDLRGYVYPVACVLATCQLVDCLPVQDVGQRRLTTQELSFGNYNSGRFAWILEDVKPLPDPIPAKGMLGLWDWKEQS